MRDAESAIADYDQSPSASPFPLDYVIDQGGQVAYFNTEYDPDAMVTVIDQLLGNAPVLTVNPSSLEFGPVGLEQTSHMMLQISNVGTGELRIIRIVTDNEVFGTNLTELVVPPNASRVVRVSFTPTEVGSVAGNLVMESNDPAQSILEVPLLGVGIEVTAVGGENTAPQGLYFGCWPNPFNAQVTIEFELAESGPIGLQVFDLRGRLVRTLLDEPRPAGRYRVRFDGRDDSRRPLATGEYIAVLKTAQRTVRQKMVLVK